MVEIAPIGSSLTLSSPLDLFTSVTALDLFLFWPTYQIYRRYLSISTTELAKLLISMPPPRFYEPRERVFVTLPAGDMEEPVTISLPRVFRPPNEARCQVLSTELNIIDSNIRYYDSRMEELAIQFAKVMKRYQRRRDSWSRRRAAWPRNHRQTN